MKAITIKSIVAVCFLSLSTSGWGMLVPIKISDTGAGMLNGLDVGQLDTYLDEGPQQGSPASEVAWINSQPGLSGFTDAMVKDSTVSYYDTDRPNTIAFKLSQQIDYFLIKNKNSIALFSNNANKDWGVIDLSSLMAQFNLKYADMTISTISHITHVNGPAQPDDPKDPPQSVAEPTGFGLLAIGALALFGSRRMSQA